MTAASELVREVLSDYGELARGALTSYLELASRRAGVYRLAADYLVSKT